MQSAPSSFCTPQAVKVSVCVRAFNHEHYILDALSSVVAQDTDFAYEILVSDDGSTDNTRDLLNAFASRHPGLIRLFFSPGNVNIGPKHWIVTLYNSARGAYVAMLDGDDFWTNPHKLQRQTRLLDEQPDVSICGHLSVRLTSFQEASKAESTSAPVTYVDLRQFLRAGKALKISSIMIRKSSLPTIPDWIFQAPAGDSVLQLECLKAGRMACLRQPMMVYRVHDTNMYAELPRHRKWLWQIRNWQILRDHAPRRYRRDVNRLISAKYHALAEYYSANSRPRRARYFARNAFWHENMRGKLKCAVRALRLEVRSCVAQLWTR